MPKQVTGYECIYCGMTAVCSYDSMLEHETRCNLNPNKKYCSCSLCKHGEIHHYETIGYMHRPITKGYGKCTIGLGGKFDHLHNYCEAYEPKERRII